LILRVNQKETIFIIIFLIFWGLGYLGLFEPYIHSGYMNIPLWLNCCLIALVLFALLVGIRSIYFQLIITDTGVTQRAFKSWTVQWNEIKNWEYSEDSDANYLSLNLLLPNEKKEILSCFLHNKNLSKIKSKLMKKVGNPLNT